MGQNVSKSPPLPHRLRAGPVSRRGKAVNHFLVGGHLFPDIELGVGKNAVFLWNILYPVVNLFEGVSLDDIAAVGKVAAFVDGYIPPVCLKVKIVFQLGGDRQVLRIVAAQIVLVLNLRVKFKALQIFRKVDNVRQVGGMRPHAEGRAEFLKIVRGHFREQAGQMVQLVQTFIFPETARKLREDAAEVIAGDEDFLIAYAVHADLL